MGEEREREDPQKLKRIAAAAYDNDNDPRWSDYWSNVLVPPHLASRLDVQDHFKRKFYQRYIVRTPLSLSLYIYIHIYIRAHQCCFLQFDSTHEILSGVLTVLRNCGNLGILGVFCPRLFCCFVLLLFSSLLNCGILLGFGTLFSVQISHGLICFSWI